MLVLNGLPNVGPVLLRRLLDVFHDEPLAILSSSFEQLRRVRGVGSKTANTLMHWEKYFNLEQEKERIAQHGVEFVDRAHKSYPGLLQAMYDPPIGLYWRGNYIIDRPCVAIVGTRQPSMYGLRVARQFGAELARLGFCIVSGMARGIDSAAHEGALAGGGPTVAVLGCGLDIIYPPENKELYDRISGQGAVVSEFPFGRRADRQTFPMRNRVVVGMCEGVIVVETAAAGGSMITARFAGEQGRLLMVLPGRIDQARALGCLQLIRDGATLVRSVDDVLEELRYERREQMKEGSGDTLKEPVIELSKEEQTVMRYLSGGELGTPDSLAADMQCPVHSVSAILTALELKRCVVKRLDGRYESRLL
ncbi:MAG: DNA-protecting protein DprA [Verrucomicrobia bacterium]|nr:DNA-protecting protein DprA [Verrucomicrobiota bacterium]